MKVINFLSGPGAGKSTTAAKLFAYMKENGCKVELVTEYAKDLTYGKDSFKLQDQLYVFAKQNHKLWRLERNEVDYVITDSALLLSLIYNSESSGYNTEVFMGTVLSVYHNYDNINIFIDRKDTGYQEYGRSQTLEEAKDIDNRVRDMLDNLHISYNTVSRDDDILQQVLEALEGKL